MFFCIFILFSDIASVNSGYNENNLNNLFNLIPLGDQIDLPVKKDFHLFHMDFSFIYILIISTVLQEMCIKIVV